MADFIKVKDERGMLRRVNVRAIVDYFVSPADKTGKTELRLTNETSIFIDHTPEQIDKAVAKPGRIVAV